MKGYWIIFVGDVTDEDAQKQYGALWKPIAKKYQATVKALDTASTLKESNGTSRVVVVEFPSLEAAKACYEGSAYQDAKQFAVRASQRELVIIEGDIA
ncbi:DUF1330 domain-containing protein [Caballeronia sp. LZ032]|uniref:DUF1330 domain-containing protein n=1 Tax=Caballeronia sp. LZ032 TaxID=3038565 RepID=UPI00285BBB41|nr:DUF1330 domain-containing protein [Caballeronia sp. LZ032]MDR5880703.1 DUF1330 domain-containing protein [Caballeronia sp. LZ032]